MEERVILVDEQDREIGTAEKQQAHREARLHRAFSVFIFNQKGEMLVHQRAAGKYHCGGLWTNACCSHPRLGETVEAAAHRKLAQEMGFDTPLREAFSFTYKVPLDHGLHEHEFDHVLVGTYDGPVQPNPDEVQDVAWIAPEQLRDDVQQRPDRYTPWFKIALERVLRHATLPGT